MINKYMFILFSTYALIQVNLSAAENSSISESIKNGSTHYNFRYRVEQVNQAGFDERALASTLRARINYTTGSYKGFSILTELDSVIAIGKEQYNSGAGTSGAERAIYPVVADPDGSEINQAYISYTSPLKTTLKLGRQRLLLDNQRFVGGVGWRQNEQTYDGLTLDKNFDSSKVTYAYINNVNRIFGDSVNAGDHASRTHLLNVRRDFSSGPLTAYYYSINNKDAAAFSTNTVGLSWKSNSFPGLSAFAYGLEYASQSDNANNPVDYRADYYRVDASYKFKPAKIYAGLEVLDGNSIIEGASFKTPLATLHAFNGWADQFLATPNEGLEDLFLGASGELNSFNWNIKYHNFSASKGNIDFGTELDFSLGKKFGKNYSALLKYADFNSGSLNYSNTSKFWFMLQANY